MTAEYEKKMKDKLIEACNSYIRTEKKYIDSQKAIKAILFDFFKWRCNYTFIYKDYEQHKGLTAFIKKFVNEFNIPNTASPNINSYYNCSSCRNYNYCSNHDFEYYDKIHKYCEYYY